MSDVILLIGLGFGDEGKGSITDHVARTTSASLVVRFNGGAQAAHTVVLDDGRHHTFAQFGSGTLAGAKTHLSRHMLVNPSNLVNEAKALEGFGLNPTDLITIDREALVTNFFQVVANQARELQRGDGRHGSCGLGIGETVSDAIQQPTQALRVGDLEDRHLMRKKLMLSRDRKRAEFGRDPLGGMSSWDPFSDDRVDYLVDLYEDFAKRYRIVDRQYLEQQLKGNGTIIFEGAQGVLLDQDYGFHPYTTWSDTTFGNARDLLQGFNGPVRKIGVLRGYMTRHGAGPFPTEDTDCGILTDQHNKWGEFQEGFRVGHFDAVLAHYALEVVGGVDELAITNLDKLGPKPKICTAYTSQERTIHRLVPKKLDAHMLEHGSELTRSLPASKCRWTSALAALVIPLRNSVSSSELIWRTQVSQVPGMTDIEVFKPVYETLPDRASIVERIVQELGTPVTICSVGPRAKDKWPTRHLRDSPWNQWNS